ncbi:MAG: histidine phosphatase family protein [Planctomycetota bacterium]
MTERRLIVMRHAKSSWDSGVANDWDRPLNERGKHDAPRIGERLAELGWVPDAVVASDARRTRETWERMASALGPPPLVTFEHGLYLEGLDAIRASSVEWNASHRTVLVLGHNPGWEDAVGELVGAPIGMTTGNAALLVGAGADWAEALLGAWKLEALLRSRRNWATSPRQCPPFRRHQSSATRSLLCPSRRTPSMC